jgi:hypothetical protein
MVSNWSSRAGNGALLVLGVFLAVGGCDGEGNGDDGEDGLKITPSVADLDPSGDGRLFTASNGTPPYVFDIKGAAADGFVLPDCVSFSDNGDGTAVVGVSEPSFVSDSTVSAADATLSATNTVASAASASLSKLDATVVYTAEDASADITVHGGPTVATLSVTDAVPDVAYATINFTPAFDGWARTHDGMWCGDSDQCVQRTSDGGAIVVAKATTLTSGETGLGNGDVWVARLNADRSVAWERVFGFTAINRAHAVIETSDGGFLVLGYYVNAGISASGAWLLKLASNGSVSWQAVYSESSMDAFCVQETFAAGGASSGYIICGSYFSGTTEAVLVKLDSSGDITWQYKYGGTGQQHASSVRQIADGGGYIVAGFDDQSGGEPKGWVFEVSADGATVNWQKRFEATGVVCELYSVEVTHTDLGAHDGYVAAGYVYFDVGSSVWAEHPYVLRLGTDGAITWQKQFRGAGDSVEERAYCVRQTSDQGFIVAGKVLTDTVNNDTDAWVARLASAGSVSWQKQYEMVGENGSAQCLAAIPGGGYFVAGNAYVSDMALWFMRINSDGTLGYAP